MLERLNGTQQENLITLLAHDPINGKLVAQLAEPELFEGEFRVIAERCIEYWEDHGKPPGVHTADLVADFIEDPGNRKAGTYKRILQNMLKLSEGVNTEYVLKTLRTFTRMQRMKDGILKSAEKLNAQGDMAIEEVEEILSDLLRARAFQFEPGLRLTSVDKVIDYLQSHYSEFRTGIAELDRRNITPARGATMLMLAPTGRGKTWFLVHVGKQALMQRQRVLHVSLEISEEEVAQRYYQSLFSIPKHRETIETAALKIDDETRKVLDYRRNKIKRPLSFDDKNIRKDLKKEVKPWEFRLPNLVIKRFPMRSLTMNGLRAFLDALEATEGFIPDMLILDYIGITATDVNNPRTSLGRSMEEFQAVCVERALAGVTAHQVSKVGAEAQFVKATHVAEDWSLIMTADQVIAFSQTDEEEKFGLARLFVAKARTEADKFGVLITQSYKLGQFCLQSAVLDKTYYEYLDEMRDEIQSDDE